MQIFVTGTAYQTALDLDRKRLSNQITEARITFDCLMGKNGWGKHPLIKMYQGHAVWLDWYMQTLRAVFRGDLASAIEFSREADRFSLNGSMRNFTINIELVYIQRIQQSIFNGLISESLTLIGIEWMEFGKNINRISYV